MDETLILNEMESIDMYNNDKLVEPLQETSNNSSEKCAKNRSIKNIKLNNYIGSNQKVPKSHYRMRNGDNAMGKHNYKCNVQEY